MNCKGDILTYVHITTTYYVMQRNQGIVSIIILESHYSVLHLLSTG